MEMNSVSVPPEPAVTPAAATSNATTAPALASVARTQSDPPASRPRKSLPADVARTSSKLRPVDDDNDDDDNPCAGDPASRPRKPLTADDDDIDYDNPHPGPDGRKKLIKQRGTSDPTVRRPQPEKQLFCRDYTCGNDCALRLIVSAIIMAGMGWLLAIVTFVYAAHASLHLSGSTIALGIVSALMIDAAILATLGKVHADAGWEPGLLTWSAASSDDGPLSMAVKVRIFIGLMLIFAGLTTAIAMIVIDFVRAPGVVFVLVLNNAIQVVAVFMFWQASEQDTKTTDI